MIKPEPTIPTHLSEQSRATWAATLAQYDLRRDELDLFEQALTQLDRASEARRHLDEHGLMISGLHGPRLNPLATVERASAATAARLFKMLGLKDDGDAAQP
jgi:hypothetical protein